MYSSNSLFAFEPNVVGASAMGLFKTLPKSKLKSKKYNAMAGPGLGLDEEEVFLRLDSRNGSKTKNRSFAMGGPIPENTGSVMLTTGFGGPFKIGNVALDNRSLKSKSENIGSTLGVRSGLRILPKPKFLNSSLTAMKRTNSGPVNGALTTISRPNSAPINSAFAIGSSVLEGTSNAQAKNIKKNLNNSF